MTVRYEKAASGDYDEVIDLGNYVFSAARTPHDFPLLLPKLYKREYFMEGNHYVAREDGRIKAVVGSYPLTMNILGEALPGRGIGMVSVHPYARSRGYMRSLMEMALEDMRREQAVFSCLGGQRQRYGYFGYAPAGINVTFFCRRANVRHVLSGIPAPGPEGGKLSLRELKAGDGELLDRISAFHRTKAARIERPREKLFDILSSWNFRVYAALAEGAFLGYLISDPSGEKIHEVNLDDASQLAARLPELIGAFLNLRGGNGDRDQVRVTVQPQEREKLDAFSRFAEDYALTSAYSFRIFDYFRFLPPFLRLKARNETLPDGSLVLRIAGEGFRISVSEGGVSFDRLGENRRADVELESPEAAELLFSALSPLSSPLPRGNAFLRALLPFPLFFEEPDGV
ncbi:MAG: GNAT family N-acetyltransferase [Treponema sp.]|jgi:predicted N-acetyltransferase YhbS|nr:GNAT family N-acetyltransferase [Treponema sp.]